MTDFINPKLLEGKIKVDPADRKTSFFVELERYLEVRLDKLRKENDKPQAEEETAVLRGSIAEIKRLMTVLNPPQFQTQAPKRPDFSQ